MHVLFPFLEITVRTKNMWIKGIQPIKRMLNMVISFPNGKLGDWLIVRHTNKNTVHIFTKQELWS
jgi:hypothetical protein